MPDLLYETDKNLEVEINYKYYEEVFRTIKTLNEDIKTCYNILNNINDGLLIESKIYEIKSLETKLKFFITEAKSVGMIHPAFYNIEF